MCFQNIIIQIKVKFKNESKDKYKFDLNLRKNSLHLKTILKQMMWLKNAHQ